ncbi:hypothetical protein DPMN_073883 [Dreissena polymorpha]|uniref:Uncharacterized protein n=1 Tax=Dreissena polymorpha TaxID=45954 RepID=A0A9D3YIL5_DREPO|nr:hypothetical protein DPMN_073883 [Dreissena polymorpha]
MDSLRTTSQQHFLGTQQRCYFNMTLASAALNGAAEADAYPHAACFTQGRPRNEEIIVKGNFGWAWSMWAGRPRVYNGAMHISNEVNPCRNEEVNLQGSSAYSVGGDSGQDEQTDGQTGR